MGAERIARSGTSPTPGGAKRRWILMLAVIVIGASADGSVCASSGFAAADASRNCTEFPGTEASPGFRAYLPNCRAFEMVTPSYEGGSPALWTFLRPPPLSSDGEHVLGQNFAGGNTENDEESGFEFGAIYEFSRTPTGWSTESLEPPASLSARRDFVEASADLSHSLWKLVVQSGAGEEVPFGEGNGYILAVREGKGSGGSCPAGSVPVPRACFTEVGPADPPESTKSEFGPGFSGLTFVGASRDLGHILLRMQAKGKLLWPGDKTREGDESLYEYTGTGNREPVLVGVKNSGQLDGKPHLNEDAELMSECGTLLGSAGEASAYNAVSADGEIIYFTALHGSCTTPEVNELYARVNGVKTVAISEPSKEDCAECIEGSKVNAEFQGASEDGSKVFFTTEQELVPGQKGENIYEYSFDAEKGHRITLVSAGSTEPQVQGIARISEDGSRVYFLAKKVLTTVPNGNGERAKEGGYSLYVYDASGDGTSFVATLMTGAEAQSVEAQATEEDEKPIKEEEGECKRFFEEARKERGEECEGEVKRLKEALPGKVAAKLAEEVDSKTGVTAKDERRPFETTANGEFLAFVNGRDLTGGEDTSTVSQVFEYDAQTEKIVRVSAGQKSSAFPEGYNDNGNTTSGEDAPRILAPEYVDDMAPTEAASALSLSEDGTVVFTSPDALTPGAVPGREIEVVEGRPTHIENVYEYREGNVYLISPADEAAPLHVSKASRLLGTDESGDDVFFFTTDSLVPQDTDTQASWYDARVGGGFPAPPSPSSCEGDSCQGPLSPTPFSAVSGGSATQTPGENVPPAVSTTTTLKPKSKPSTRAQRLAKALNACKKIPTKRRAACNRLARERYGHFVRSTKGPRRSN